MTAVTLRSACQGVPVGAFVVERHNLNAVVALLRQRSLLKHGRNVTPYRSVTETEPNDSALFAVHTQGNVPDDVVSSLVPTVALRYERCVRVQSAECKSVRSEDCSSSTALSSCDATTSSSEKPYRMIELFAGIGMFRLAGEQGNLLKSVFSSEIAEPARYVYQRNFGGPPSVGDITEVPDDQVPDHDVLTAGFPCQSFSIAGSAPRGFEDSRGALFFEVVRVLAAKRPKALLLENVANLVVLDDGAAMETVLTSLRDVGYVVAFRVIDSAVVLPQRRQRVYIVGFRWDICGDRNMFDDIFAWPKGLEEEAPRSASIVQDILDPIADSDTSLRVTESQWDMIRHRKDRDLVIDVEGKSKTLMGSYRKSFQKYSQFVLVPSQECQSQEIKHSALRFLSVQECARLQGIPDSFEFFSTKSDQMKHDSLAHSQPCAPNGAYKLIGNAVSPLVVAPILQAICDSLDRLLKGG